MISFKPTNPITLGMLTLATLSPSQWNAEQITSKCDCYCAGCCMLAPPSSLLASVTLTLAPFLLVSLSWSCNRRSLYPEHREMENNVFCWCVNYIECVNVCFVKVNKRGWVTNLCTKCHHDPGYMPSIHPYFPITPSHSWVSLVDIEALYVYSLYQFHTIWIFSSIFHPHIFGSLNFQSHSMNLNLSPNYFLKSPNQMNNGSEKAYLKLISSIIRKAK